MTGTFLPNDPLGVSPAWPGNPYPYADGNPATLVDPYGLFGLPSWSDIKSGAKTVGGAIAAPVETGARMVGDFGSVGVPYIVSAEDPIGFMLQSATRLALEGLGSNWFLGASALWSSGSALAEKQP